MTLKVSPKIRRVWDAKHLTFRWFHNIKRAIRRATMEQKCGGVITPRATDNVSWKNYNGSWRFPSSTGREHFLVTCACICLKRLSQFSWVRPGLSEVPSGRLLNDFVRRLARRYFYPWNLPKIRPSKIRPVSRISTQFCAQNCPLIRETGHIFEGRSWAEFQG